MGETRLTTRAYQQLFNEDIAWLDKQPYSLESAHIKEWLKWIRDNRDIVDPDNLLNKMRKLIIAVDFDGTIVEHKYPQCGEFLPGALEVLSALKAVGHILVLNTCREDHPTNINKKYLTEAVEKCREAGIEFDAVNETPKEYEFRDEPMKSRKIHANVYIDDKNLGGFRGWEHVKTVLL